MKAMKKVLAVVLLSVVSAVAAPFDAELVPGDANWVLHIDFAALRASQIGKAMLEDELDAAGKEQLKQAKDMFGMDPRTDLNAMTIYGAGAAQDDFVMLVQGKLNSSKMIAHVKGLSGYQASRHAGREVHSWVDGQDDDDKPSRMYGAVWDGSRGLISKSLPSLQTALAVLDGKHDNLMKGKLDTKVMSGQGLLLAAAADLRNVKLPANPMLANAKPGLFRMQARETGGNLAMQVAVQQESVQSAQQAETMLNGFKMMGQMQMQQENPNMASVLQAITIGRNNDVLTLSMTYPAAKIVEMMKSAAQSSTAQ
jgi:hypothetical protein